MNEIVRLSATGTDLFSSLSHSKWNPKLKTCKYNIKHRRNVIYHCHYHWKSTRLVYDWRCEENYFGLMSPSRTPSNAICVFSVLILSYSCRLTLQSFLILMFFLKEIMILKSLLPLSHCLHFEWSMALLQI